MVEAFGNMVEAFSNNGWSLFKHGWSKITSLKKEKALNDLKCWFCYAARVWKGSLFTLCFQQKNHRGCSKKITGKNVDFCHATNLTEGCSYFLWASSNLSVWQK